MCILDQCSGKEREDLHCVCTMSKCFPLSFLPLMYMASLITNSKAREGELYRKKETGGQGNENVFRVNIKYYFSSLIP